MTKIATVNLRQCSLLIVLGGRRCNVNENIQFRVVPPPVAWIFHASDESIWGRKKYWYNFLTLEAETSPLKPQRWLSPAFHTRLHRRRRRLSLFPLSLSPFFIHLHTKRNDVDEASSQIMMRNDELVFGMNESFSPSLSSRSLLLRLPTIFIPNFCHLFARFHFISLPLLDCVMLHIL
jgi:hypothetical protein